MGRNPKFLQSSIPLFYLYTKMTLRETPFQYTPGLFLVTESLLFLYDKGPPTSTLEKYSEVCHSDLHPDRGLTTFS